MERRIRGNVYVRCGSGEKQEITSNAYLSTSTDQRLGVVKLAKKLKGLGFHIIMFSWHSRQWFKDNWRSDELSCFDVIITEPYDATEKIYDYSLDDGIHNAIGSGNQEIWLEPGAEDYAFKAAEINSLEMDVKNTMRINLKNGASYTQQEH